MKEVARFAVLIAGHSFEGVVMQEMVQADVDLRLNELSFWRRLQLAWLILTNVRTTFPCRPLINYTMHTVVQEAPEDGVDDQPSSD